MIYNYSHMKKNLYTWLSTALFVSCFVLFNANTAKASHATGCDLTFTWAGGNTYNFTLTFYRDCSGIAAPTNPTLNVLAGPSGCGGAAGGTVQMTAQGGGVEITPLCVGSLGSSTCNGGTVPGIQQYIYTGTYTFPSNCRDWQVTFSECCRNSQITTAANASGFNLFVNAQLNNLDVTGNGSPDFTTPPVPYLCAGQPFTYNNGVVDGGGEGDSIVYSLVNPRSTATTVVPITAPLSPTQPLATTGAGVTFSSATGTIGLTPTAGQVGIVTIRIREYRNGILISVVERDVQLIVVNCAGNNTPTVSAPVVTSTGSTTLPNGQIRICPGQTFSMQLTGSDADAAQVINFTTNLGIVPAPFPGATFTTTGTNPRTGTFTWTPGPNSVGQATLAIGIRDNACPIFGSATRGITIIVQGVNGRSNKKTICRGAPTVLNLTSQATELPGGQYQWSANPPVTFSPNANAQNPTVTITQPTVFTVRYQDGICNAQDTIIVGAYGPVSATPATVTYCALTDPPLALSAVYPNPAPPIPIACGVPSPVPACSGAFGTRIIGNVASATNTSTTGGAGTPFQGFWHDGRVQYLITAAELTAAGVQPGLINRLSFDITTKTSTIPYNGMTISMGCTSLNALTTFVAGLTTVYNPNAYTTVAGTNVFNFNSVYRWDGISNIVVQMCYDNTAFTNYDHVRTSPTTFNSVAYARQDNSVGCTLGTATVSTARPVMIFRSCQIIPPAGAITYAWTSTPAGQVIAPATSANPTATPTGPNGSNVLYIVTASDGTCTSRDTVNVTLACLACNVTAAVTPPQIITCARTTVQLDASTPSTGNGVVSYAWSTANGTITSASNIGIITVSKGGTYCVTVSNVANGTTCTATACVTVVEDKVLPTVNANSDITTITCGDAAALISAQTNCAAAPAFYGYAWSTPLIGGCSGTVSAGGTYTVTVTGNAAGGGNGCTASASVTVAQNTTPPVACIDPAPSTTCTNPTVVVSAACSTPPGAAYKWSTDPINHVFVTNTVGVGTFTVTVTTPSNGCSATASVTVVNNNSAPTPTIVANRTVVNCRDNDATLTVNTAPLCPNCGYNWPAGVVSSAANTAVVINGTYTVTISDPTTGCTRTASIVITQNLTLPVVVMGPVTQLTCASSSTTVNACASTPAGNAYAWDNGLSPGCSNIVGSSGVYIVTVTHPVSFCTATGSVTVTSDGNVPTADLQPITPLNTFVLSCATPNITIRGTSTTGAVTLGWSPNTPTPSGNTSGSTAVITQPGTYLVTVTAGNGCTASANVIITRNTTQPVVSIPAARTLTCDTLTTDLLAIGGDAWVWAGPGLTTAPNVNPATANLPGIYTVTATDATNGCTATRSITVISNTGLPTAALTAPNTALNCTRTFITLTATGGVSYVWSPPAASPSFDNASALTAGTYTVTAKGANGCTASASIAITLNDTPPPIAITNTPLLLTCTLLSTTLTATAGLSNYIWDGPVFSTSGNTAVAQNVATYSVTATDPVNTCTNSATITVGSNYAREIPTITSNGILDCNNPTRVLTAATVAPSTFAWSNSSVAGATTTVNAAGIYTVTATLTSTGCTSTASFNVISDFAQPVASVAANPAGVTEIRCNVPSITLQASAVASGGATYVWDANVASATGSSATVTAGNTYSVIAMQNSNGCKDTATIIITQNTTPPAPSISANRTTVTCANPTATLTASGGDTYTWANSPLTGNIITVTPVGASTTYTVTATTTANGCTAVTTIAILQDISVPTPLTITNNFAQLDCNNTTNVLTANGGDSWIWSLGGAITQTLSVTSLGNYTVTATKATTGCTASTTLAVTQDIRTADVTIAPPADLNCNNATVPLTASNTIGTATYAWSGAGLLTPPSSNPASVNVAGSYTVVATLTATGCTSTVSTNVARVTTTPAVVINAPATITCDVLTVELIAVFGDSWVWSGVVSSNDSAAVVNQGGTYTVTATLAATGCTASTTVVVAQDTIRPTVNLTATPNPISCAFPTADICATILPASAVIGGYQWTNTIVSTTGTCATVNATGAYTVTVTRSDNGCTNTAALTINGDFGTPTVSIAQSSPQLNCSVTNITLTAGSGASYAWTGSQPFTNINGNEATIDQPGIYTVVVTAANGCTDSRTVAVTQSTGTPTVSINPPATLTCRDTTVTLTATSSVTGSYGWSTGTPTATATVSLHLNGVGPYTVTVTDPANSCTGTASVLVTVDTLHPTVNLSVNLPLTCGRTSVTLTDGGDGNAWAWSGGAVGTNNTAATPNTPGAYTVTATFAGNGCTTTASVAVLQDLTAPIPSITSDFDTLFCNRLVINLTAANTVPQAGDTWSWSPVNSFATNTATVIAPSVYIVTATSGLTGCTASATRQIFEDKIAPVPQLAASAPDITCTTLAITLTATGGSNYAWAASPALTVTGNGTASVTAAGTYTVTATRAFNGCTAIKSITIGVQNTNPTVTLTTPNELTCDTLSTTVTATGGGTYAWTTGLGIVSGGATAQITQPGQYFVTVTTPSNGCTTVGTVNVSQNTTQPSVSIAQPLVLNCSRTSVTLTASGGTSWVWSNNVASSSTNVATASGPDTYTVTATDAANGCKQSTTIAVTRDIAAPLATLQSGLTNLDCNNRTTTLVATGGTGTSAYVWSGTSPVTDLGNGQATVAAGGTYTVVVTDGNGNGCATTRSVSVTQNFITPQLTLSANVTVLDCRNPIATLTAAVNFSNPAPSYVWSPTLTTNNNQATVNLQGNYTVTVTNPLNGCTAFATIAITQDTISPRVTIAQPLDLTCGRTTVAVLATAPTSCTYLWNDAAPTAVAALSTTTPGTFTVTATQVSNGCTATNSATVILDNALPVITASTSGIGVLTCDTLSIRLTATGGGEYLWSNNLGSNPIVNVATAGTYTVTVTNTVNRCTLTAAATVTLDRNLPTVTIVPSQAQITCTTPSITLSASSSTPGVTYLWTGAVSNPTGNPVTVTAGGTYTVQVSNPANGCTGNTTQVITENTNKPNVSVASNIPTITCTNPVATLTATTTPSAGITYAWSNNIQNAGTNTATAIAAGLYLVTATDGANGCTAKDSIQINLDKLPPTASINPPATITCSNRIITLTAQQGDVYAWSSVVSSNGNTAQVSVAGNYTVTVTTTSNGCSAVANTTVGDDVLFVNQVTLSVDGLLTCAFPTRTLLAQGGDNYQWGVNVASSNGASATVVAVGTYTVTATQANNGCTSTQAIVVGNNTTLPTPAITANATILDCANQSIALNATGGDSYTWSANAVAPSGGSANAGSAGIYTVIATNAASGCTLASTITITQDIQIPTIAFTRTNVTCYGRFDGTIDLTVTNTTAPTFLWSNTSTNQNQVGLAANTYTVTATGTNGCTATKEIIVEQPAQVSTTFAVTNVLCAGTATGRIVAIPTGGTGTYNYGWSNVFGAANNGNLAAGTYTVTITDVNGCTGTASATVTEPSPLAAVAIQDRAVRCTGQANAHATVTPSGGVAPYTVKWDSNEDSTTALLLNVGVHTVTITDANQCSKTATITITEPAVVAATTTNTAALCYQTPTGIAIATGTGGVLPYAFQWSDGYSTGGATSTHLNLIKGTYYITVTDLNGCSTTTSTSIAEPSPISVAVVPQDAKCAFSADGKGTATSSGGTPASATNGYTYRWDSGESTNPGIALIKGSHTVTATDANGCTASTTFAVQGPDAITLNTKQITNVSCFGLTNGSATIGVLGGSPGYTYAWSAGSGSATQNNLAAGSYTVSVTDANGCTMPAVTVQITEPAQLQVTAITPQAAECNGANSGKITVTAAGGTTPYSYNWSNGAFGTPLLNVASGDYTVVVSDANQCTNSARANVGEPTAVSAVATAINARCYGDRNGAIRVTGAAGGASPYVYSLDGISFSSSDYFTGVPAGNYNVRVQDANGCEKSLPLTVGQSDPIQLNAGDDQSIKLGESAQLQAVISANGTVLIAWNPPSTLSDPTISAPVARPLETTVYNVTVIDTMGCRVTDEVRVTVVKKRACYVPTAFSPNGDQNNDFFTIFAGVEVSRIKSMKVFDRWGAMMYEAADFLPNDAGKGWDGYFRGQRLNPGVFVYFIEVEFKDGVTEMLKGDVTLLK